MRTMLKGKIHRARVTGANLHYEGSVTLDPVLMEAADLLPYEQVHLLNIDNGNRLTTYVIEGERGSGEVVVNGAGELVSVSIDKALLENEDLEMVQDLVVAAVNAGLTKSNEMVEAEVEKVTGGMRT